MSESLESQAVPSFGEFLGTEGGANADVVAEPVGDLSRDVVPFNPIKTLEVGKYWSKEDKALLDAIPHDRNYIIGYTDMSKHGKGVTDVDRVAVLETFLAQEGHENALSNVMKRDITLTNKAGEEWTGKISSAMEIWSFDRNWFLLPPSADNTDEAERIQAVLEAHNNEEKMEWTKGAKNVKERSISAKSSKDDAEKPVHMTPEEAREDQKRKQKELFEDETVQKLAQMSIENASLPWFVIIYLLPDSLKDKKDRGIMRVFGPFRTQDESSKMIKALSRSFPHASVRGTQQYHLGALETCEAVESEEFIFADKQISDWVQPAAESRIVSDNFDDLLSDRQRMYREMCAERGITPKIVEDGGGKVLEMSEK